MKKIFTLVFALLLVNLSIQEEASTPEPTKDASDASTNIPEPTIEDGVTVLTDANINRFLAENKYVFVEFFARNNWFN